MSHVLEHVPPTRRYAEGCEVSKINTILSPTTEDIHGIIDKSCGVAFSGNGDISDAFLLAPTVRARIVGPDIIEPCDTVRAAEEVELVVPRDD